MKKLIILILAITIISSIKCNENSSNKITSNEKINIKEQLIEAKTFCKKNDLNNNICILIDMSIHSGKNRLFLYDLSNFKIIDSMLCSHGCGMSQWSEDNSKTTPEFNNIPGSHCTSLGKYKIGKRGYSNWGINVNYKLHGLEYTNDNAYSRDIVLHSWNKMSNYEVFPKGSPEGQGCPAVSNEKMKKLDKIIMHEKGNPNILMWIYKN